MSIAASRVVDEVFPKRDIGIYCPVCKKECIFEWVVFRKGERLISQMGFGAWVFEANQDVVLSSTSH